MKEKQLTVADEVDVKEKIWNNRDDLDDLDRRGGVRYVHRGDYLRQRPKAPEGGVTPLCNKPKKAFPAMGKAFGLFLIR